MGTPENRPNYAAGPNWPAGARLPIPGNAEWLWWAGMSVVVAIVGLASAKANGGTWVESMT